MTGIACSDCRVSQALPDRQKLCRDSEIAPTVLEKGRIRVWYSAEPVSEIVRLGNYTYR